MNDNFIDGFEKRALSVGRVLGAVKNRIMKNDPKYFSDLAKKGPAGMRQQIASMPKQVDELKRNIPFGSELHEHSRLLLNSLNKGVNPPKQMLKQIPKEELPWALRAADAIKKR
jgi:hypothetical protein